MISNMAESFWDWYRLNSISTVLRATFSYFTITMFLYNFRDFQVFVFGCKAQNENLEPRKIFILGYKAEMHLCYDHYFNFWRVKYDISKNELNLINLERSEALKRQIPATWSPIRLNHFDFDVILTVFQVFWSYILMLQYLLYVVFVEFPWFRVFVFG